MDRRKKMTLVAAATMSVVIPVFAAVAPNPGGAVVVTNSTTSSYLNRYSTTTVTNYQAQVLGFETLAINNSDHDLPAGTPTYGSYDPSLPDDMLVTQWNQSVPGATTTTPTSSSPITQAELNTAFATVTGDVSNSIDSLATSILGFPGRNNLLAGQGNQQQGTAAGAVAVNSTGPVGTSTVQTGSTTTDTKTTQQTGTQTTTTTTTFGPGTILVGDNQSDTFTILNGQTDININTDIQYYEDIATTNTNTQTSTYNVLGYKIVSPIVLNLDGTGKIQASDGEWKAHPTKMHMSHRVMFDFYGNGFPVAMEWVGPKDGLLCQPKADGSIDGTCLFGTSTGSVNGFEQLAGLDLNMDGHLSGHELDTIKVWRDLNGNGKADAGELKSLKETGITDLNLKNRDSKASFTMNGKVCQMFDWWPTVLELKKMKSSV